MPFLPDNEEDRIWDRMICTHPEHNPPNMMVITKAMVWMCPHCGCKTNIFPTKATLEVKDK